VTTSRRSFLKLGAATGAAALLPGIAARAAPGHGPTLHGQPRRRPLNILVLGGTRYLGPPFVRAALARGHGVTLFNRGQTQPWLFPGLTRLRGNRFPESGEGLKALAAGEWDIVVDLCAQYPRIVEASTRLLASRAQRYMLVSSISVYADLQTVGLDESGPLRVLNREYEELPDLYENDWPTYGARKAAGEAIVAGAFGDRAILIRPCSICGGDNNDGSGAYWTDRLFRYDSVLAPGDGTDPTQLVDVADVAEFMVLAAEQSLSGAYNVLGPDRTLTVRHYLETAAVVAGSRARIHWKGDFEGMTGLPLVPPYRVVPGFATMNNGKAVRAGLRFRPLEETLRSNWVDHRSRRGDTHDFAAAGTGLTRSMEEALIAEIAGRTADADTEGSRS
jgi:2'-hydroxyisoflavone reductase